jgi:hypothetical protein
MIDTFRILVTGTRLNGELIREYVHTRLDAFVLDGAIPQGRPIAIVHGACPVGGVDWYADEWAKVHGHQTEPYPAERRYGRLLGPERNTRMVATRPDWCLGFPAAGSRGTWDCLEKAVNARIPTEVYMVGPMLMQNWQAQTLFE